jgi:hypothetical protein
MTMPQRKSWSCSTSAARTFASDESVKTAGTVCGRAEPGAIPRPSCPRRRTGSSCGARG